MNSLERKTVILLAGIYASRMLGLFLIFPTFSLLANGLANATPTKIGLALGIYSLAQAVLQIPVGMLSDIIGRKKVLYAGLSLFLLGSILAAFATDINTMIIARLLQGSGAVSAVCLAYVADSIRGENHGKAMAIIGMSIGTSFIVSFVIGSMIGGLTGLFILMIVLATLALLFAYALPKPPQKLAVFDPADFMRVAKDARLLLVNTQIALLHMSLSASFFLLPILLKSHFPDSNRIVLYVLPIIFAFIFAMPLIRKTRGIVAKILPWQWLVLSVALILFSFSATLQHLWLFMLVLGLFFFAFTYIEAMLPSRLFQLATETSRGATSGVFSVYQYSGNFLGGWIGAKLYTIYSTDGTIESAFYVLSALTLVVTAVTFFIQRQTKQR